MTHHNFPSYFSASLAIQSADPCSEIVQAIFWMLPCPYQALILGLCLIARHNSPQLSNSPSGSRYPFNDGNKSIASRIAANAAVFALVRRSSAEGIVAGDAIRAHSVALRNGFTISSNSLFRFSGPSQRFIEISTNYFRSHSMAKIPLIRSSVLELCERRIMRPP